MPGYIPGYGRQGKQDIWLTRAEAEGGEATTFAGMKKFMAENFREGTFTSIKCSTETGIQPYMLLVSHHAVLRSLKRNGPTGSAELLSVAVKMLANPDVGEYVSYHSVFWDSRDNWVKPLSEEGVRATLVIFEEIDECLYFESGFCYIRVKTVWNKKSGLIRPRSTTAPIKVFKDGTISTDELEIEEIQKIVRRDADIPADEPSDSAGET